MALDFEKEFKTLTEFPPFGWQKRLYEQFRRGELPAALDLPTGLGKTSVMAIWLVAMAAGDKLPRRLVYVVDRRAVVDQATRFAEQLREKMGDGLAQKLQAGEGGKFPISTLRGGFADNREWLEDPSRPAIIVGTIDMIGSRLLFEGYGVSRGMRPYYAGFLGVDSLVVLDEAHLCPPFEELLRSVAVHRDDRFGPAEPGVAGDEKAVPPFRLLSLSATGRQEASTNSAPVFRLEENERCESTVKERLTARKRLNLSEIKDSEELPAELVRRAVPLGYGDAPARVLVFCNSRRVAVEVKKGIDKEIKSRFKEDSNAPKGVSELLVGERRGYERSVLEGWLDENGFFGGSGVPSKPPHPVFLIATSAGEVGVDLDADHMVCDLVAYERMVQRLGRVNRRGGAGRNAAIEVVAAVPQPPKPGSGKDKKEAHEKAKDRFNAEYNVMDSFPGENGKRDVSPKAILKLRSEHEEKIKQATTLAPLYPELTRPHLEAWAMTSLKQHAGRTEVAPWLRGWEKDEEPQVNIVWRKYLPCCRRPGGVTVLKQSVTEFFQSAGVHASEKLEAPRRHAWEWLLKCAKSVEKRAGEPENRLQQDDIAALVLDRTGDCVAHASLEELLFLGRSGAGLSKPDSNRQNQEKEEWLRRLAGTTLVLDARMGGLSDGLLDDKSKGEAPTADAAEHWRKLRQDADEGSLPLITFRVEALKPASGGEGLEAPELTPELEEWRHVRTFETEFDAGGGVRSGLAVYKWAGELGDDNSLSVLSSPQALTEHAEQVAQHAERIANNLGLPEKEIDALRRAALAHDYGKAAQRWQDAMNAPEDGRPYAKTRGGGNWRLLEGYRHEFGSLLKAEQDNLPDETRDLILHLVAAHHGNARPLLSSAGCEKGPPSLLEAKAGEAALRFARLQKKYGIWGLAWREAILRAADQKASREWDAMSREQSRDG